MSLAIFDLDNTLLAGDSDHSWGEFLIARNIVDGDSYREANDNFYRDYQNGTLDIVAYQEFALQALVGMEAAQRSALHREFMSGVIEPMMLPKARALLDKHRRQGDTLLIITATNSFVTAPIAQALGVDNLLATEPEMDGDRFTGRIAGVPCFQGGKVTRLQHWLAGRDETLEGAWFYSDSANDIPLLEEVDNPVAVDPDARLTEHAKSRGWPIISLR